MLVFSNSAVSVVPLHPVLTVMVFLACTVSWVFIARAFTADRFVLPVRLSGAGVVVLALVFLPMLRAYVCGGTEDWWFWYGTGCWLLYW